MPVPLPPVETRTGTPLPLGTGEASDIPIYPGAVMVAPIQTVLNLARGSGTYREERVGSFTVGDPLDKVYDWYMTEMARNGWEVQQDAYKTPSVFVTWRKFPRWQAQFRPVERDGVRTVLLLRSEMGDLSHLYAGPDISPDGVELTDFSVWCPNPLYVGDTVKVRFTLRNTTRQVLTFKPTGVFVGARAGSQNRDFGHQEIAMRPGEWVTFDISNKVQDSGVLAFWPAYYLNGNWGPYQWHVIYRASYKR